ncbi:MAG: hypothetical protein ACRDBX_04060 [Erysipelotrichaceae bacterium]
MNRLRGIAQALYQNKAVLMFGKMHFIIGLIMFFVVTSIVSVPFYLGRFQVNEQEKLQRFPGVEAALGELFANEACGFENARFVCETKKVVYQGYTFDLMGDVDQPFAPNTIVFGKDGIVMQGQSEADQIVGSYQNFGSTRFAYLSELVQKEGVNEIVALFVRNVLHSNLGSDLIMVYMVNLLQNMTYLFLASLMFKFTGIRKKKGLSIFESINIAIVAMVGPALLSALVGLYNTGIGSMMYPVLYMARATFLYMRLIKAPSVTLVSE